MMALALTQDLKKRLAERFSSVKVSKKALKNAENVMNGKLMDCWEEKMVHNITRGVPIANLEQFTNYLADSIALNGEQKQRLQAAISMMNFAESTESEVLEMNFNMDKFNSIYGFVSAVQERDGIIAIGYAFHKLKFEMSEVAVELTFKDVIFHPSFVLIERRETVKFNSDDIHAIKNAFGRHRALESLRSQGVISAINYEE